MILAAWPTSHRSSRTSPPRAPTSTASSPTCPPRNGRPRPRPPAGASRTRSRTSPGPTMPPSRPRPTPAGSPTSCAPPGRTRTGSSTRPPRRVRTLRTCSRGGAKAAPVSRQCSPPSHPDASSTWFGPPMSAASMATARLMETWAHGQDVADALGVTPGPDREAAARRAHRRAHPRLRLRRPNQQVPPTAEFRVELASPDGEKWTWGPEDAAQRRHRPGARLLPARHPAPPPRRPRPRRRGPGRRALARPSPRHSPGRPAAAAHRAGRA